MYLDILGPSVTEATPAPQRHVGSISRGCPRSLLKWVLVVFTAFVYETTCAQCWRGSCLGWGGGWEREGSSSLMSLFVGNQSAFLWLLLNVLCRLQRPSFQRKGGASTHTLPCPARPSCRLWCTWLSEKPPAELSVFLALVFKRAGEDLSQGPELWVSDAGSLSSFSNNHGQANSFNPQNNSPSSHCRWGNSGSKRLTCAGPMCALSTWEVRYRCDLKTQ